MSSLPEQIGPYLIRRRLGKGGSGHVYEGRHQYLERRAAIKILAPEYAKNRQAVARFIREAKVLAQFDNHPGIVRVIEICEPEHDAPYLVMELLEGKNLRARLEEQAGPFEQNVALALGQTIASIMVDVHAKGLVHRDLKPENIMLAPNPDKPLGFQVKIVDFGIAKAPEPADTDGYALTHFHTKGHDVLGTPAYAAPEQCRNADNVTAQTDVYALGILMHELLAGKRPFLADSELELMWMHDKEVPPNLHDLVPSIPPNLATFITSMLSKEPLERPSMRDCRDTFALDWSRETNDCPFPGLQPFHDKQTHLFFGRNKEKDLILNKLGKLREGRRRRWLQIQGPSGIGKSSLIQAAILPEIIRSKNWCVISMRPGEDPLLNLAVVFAKGFQQDEAKLVAAFRNNLGALDEFFEKTDGPILLVIDAFEELFALGASQLPKFTQWLTKALGRSRSPLRLLTTIRSDYLHRFDQALGLAQLLDRRAVRYDLRPMKEADLEGVVKGMAGRTGLRLSKGLAEKMVRDAAGTDCHLPLLGHTLRSLWLRRSREEISREQYANLGGVGGALANRVDELLNSFQGAGRERAKWLILDLVQVGQGGPDTRRPRTREDVLRAAGKDKLAEDVLARLSGLNVPADEEPFRLVMVSDTETNGETKRQMVELVHDMVLHKVPVVVSWINEHRALLEVLGALESLAREWFIAGKPKRDLPAGTLLDHYRGGKEAARVQQMASANARAFLDEAIRQQARQKWLKRGIRAMMAVAVVAIVVNAVRAEREKERAELALGLAEHEQIRAEIEKTRAEMEAQHARNSLRLVIDMVDKIVNEVDWQLGRIGHTFETRKKLMTPLREELMKLPPVDQELARVAIIDTLQRSSDFERLHGKIEEAERAVVDAENLINAVLTKDPNNKEFVALLAMNYSKRGKLRLIQNDKLGALEDFENSIDAFREANKSGEFRDDHGLATSLIEKGDTLVALGRLELARDSYSEGLGIRQGKGINLNDYAKAMVAEALMLRSQTTTDGAVAKTDLNAALEFLEPIVDREKHNLLYQSILCRIRLLQAKIYRTEKDVARSRAAYAEAKRIAEMLHENAPEQKEYALLLAESLVGSRVKPATVLAIDAAR